MRKVALASIAVGLTAFLGAVPVFAASKVIDARGQNVPFTVFGANACAPREDAAGKFNSHFIRWDNAHFELSFDSIAFGVDPVTGASTGGIGGLRLHRAGETGGLPLLLQSHFTITCQGTGRVINIQVGLTIDEKGNVHVR